MPAHIALLILLAFSPQPRQHANTPESATKNKQNSEQKANPSAPLRTNVPATASQKKTPNSKSFAERHGWNYYDAIAPNTWSSWFLVIAGIGGILAAIFTLHSINRQTKATEATANATKNSIDILVSKERARLEIGMRGPPTIPGPDDPSPIAEVTYAVRCHGTTPAYISETRGWSVITEHENPPKGDSYLAMQLPTVLSPSGEVKVTIPLYYDPLYSGSHADMREEISKRRLFIHFSGTIGYSDIFGGKWVLNFRYMWFVSLYTQGGWVGRSWDEKDEEAPN